MTTHACNSYRVPSKNFDRRCDEIRDVRTAQPTFTAPGIEVGIHPRRIPSERLFLFMPGQRTFRGQPLLHDSFTFLLQLKQDFAWQRAGQAECHEVRGALPFEMGKDVSRMEPRNQVVGRCWFGFAFHERRCAKLTPVWQASSGACGRGPGFPACGF